MSSFDNSRAYKLKQIDSARVYPHLIVQLFDCKCIFARDER
jgi:hypothetical protein